MSYRVIAPYVTVRLRDDAGVETVRGFYTDGILPPAVMKESVDSLLAKGMVERVADPRPVPASPEPGDRPAGNGSREAWAAYATTKGAPEEETRTVDEGGLSRDDLRTRYGG